jgi:hypothetical protein
MVHLCLVCHVISTQETEQQQTDWKDTKRTDQIGEPKDHVSLLCDLQITFSSTQSFARPTI